MVRVDCGTGSASPADAVFVSLMLGLLMKVVVAVCACVLMMPSTILADSLEAYHGQPFGIARLTLSQPETGPRRTEVSTRRLAERLSRDHVSLMRFPVTERSGLVEKKGGDGTLHSIYFLFDDADSLSFALKSKQNLKTTVRHDKVVAQKFLDRWWRLYVAQASANASNGKTPVELEQYLVSMLARRHGKPTPRIARPNDFRATSADDVIAILTGAESLQLAMQKDDLLNADGRGAQARLPIPEAVSPPPVEIPEVEGVVEIEHLANLVPSECFYARFRSFEDFQWFRKRMGEWGTDLRGMVSASSLDYEIPARLQRQLQLFDDDLFDVLEKNELTDMAVIGTDTFFNQGAAIGFLLRAEDSAGMRQSLLAVRKRLAGQDDAVKEETFRLDGFEVDVSLLSSADNSVRSYYVTAENHHFITTSLHILERFLQVVTTGEGSLGSTSEFRFARSLYPLQRDQAVFLHLSDPFFRNLVNPSFRIEMTRRALFQADVQQYQLAVMAAKAEGLESNLPEDLKSADFLPASFGKYPDGSEFALVDGRPVNTARGAVGAMIPIVDVDVKAATQREIDGYRDFSNRYRRIWTRMDPASIGIVRKENDGVEHLIMDLHVFPVPVQEYGMITSFLSPPTEQRLALPPTCLFLFEVDLRFIGNGKMFAGILDQDIPFHEADGQVTPVSSSILNHPAFLGGDPSYLRLFHGQLPDVEVGEFFETDSLWPGGWGYRGEEFVVQASTKENTQLVTPHLVVQKAPRSAQARLHVGDLSSSRMLDLAHALAWQRTNKIAKANEYLPDRLSAQLHVSPEVSMKAAQTFLGGKPTCPFGGEYRLIQRAGGLRKDAWRSTEAPKWSEYRLPILDQVRGAEAELSVSRTTLTTHAEIWLGK